MKQPQDILNVNGMKTQSQTVVYEEQNQNKIFEGSVSDLLILFFVTIQYRESIHAYVGKI